MQPRCIIITGQTKMRKTSQLQGHLMYLPARPWWKGEYVQGCSRSVSQAKWTSEGACEHRLRCKSNSIAADKKAAEKGSLARKGEESDNRKTPADRYTSEKMSQEHLIINQDNMEQKKNIPKGTAHGCGNW